MSGLTGDLQADLGLIQAAMKECDNVKTCAAEKLGVSESTIRRRLKKAEIELDTEHQLSLARDQIQILRKELTQLRATRFRDRAFEQLVRGAAVEPAAPPSWVVEAGSPGSPTVANQMLSDVHYAEVVNPREMMWLNAYDPAIAERRLHRFFEGAVRIVKEILSNMNIQGLVQFWTGDFFSGDIHDELVETNAYPVLPAVLTLRDLLVAGVQMMRQEVGLVHIEAVPGNHPRLSRRPKHKGYATSNLDWLLYHLVATEFRDDPNVTFRISGATDQQVTVLGHRYHLTHGDQAKGGSGISGAVNPLMILDHRKRKWAMQTGNEYDTLALGHWHQALKLPGVMANGSVVGYSEYSVQKNFPYAPAQQQFWLTHPTRGIIFDTPIFVESKEEGWQDNRDWQPDRAFSLDTGEDEPDWLEGD